MTVSRWLNTGLWRFNKKRFRRCPGSRGCSKTLLPEAFIKKYRRGRCHIQRLDSRAHRNAERLTRLLQQRCAYSCTLATDNERQPPSQVGIKQGNWRIGNARDQRDAERCS